MNKGKAQELDLSFIENGQLNCLVQTYINKPLLIELPLLQESFSHASSNLLVSKQSNKRLLECTCQTTQAKLDLLFTDQQNNRILEIEINFLADYHSQEKYNNLLKNLVDAYQIQPPVTVRVRGRKKVAVIVIDVPYENIEEYHAKMPGSFENTKIEINSVIN